MRLAYLCADSGIPYGGTKGASVHVKEIVQALVGQGIDVLLLVICVEGSPPALPGLSVQVLPGPGRGASVAERSAAEPQLIAWLRRCLAEWGADVLYERISLHSAAGSHAAKELGIPHVVEMNAPLPQEAATYRGLEHPEDAEFCERVTLSGADLVYVVSRPLVEYARSRGARDIEVLPNGVNIEQFWRRSDQQCSTGAVFAGTLRPWHGVETIAQAWRVLGSDAPPLLVVGDGPGLEILTGVGAKITGAVRHKDVPDLLASAAIGLAPYSPDAPDYFSPLKLFEYLAAGLAVIAADLPGVRDIVGEHAAVLIPAGDAEALAAAVAALGGDLERRIELSAAGHRLVATRHTWHHRAQQIIAGVERLQCSGAQT